MYIKWCCLTKRVKLHKRLVFGPANVIYYEIIMPSLADWVGCNGWAQ
jgi:hypothetical protein